MGAFSSDAFDTSSFSELSFDLIERTETPGLSFAVFGSISGNGKGLFATITDNGVSVKGEINESGVGVVGLMNATGSGVDGPIN